MKGEMQNVFKHCMAWVKMNLSLIVDLAGIELETKK